jgi:alkylation response protein AidB-like acyl-CoA dehydrogenase
MNLTETAEHRSLREAVRGVLADAPTAHDVTTGRLVSTDAGRQLWLRLARELGLQGLAIAERFGGSGYSAVERAVVVEEMGRVLYPGPYLATTVIAAELIAATGDEAAAADYLPRIADGTLTAAAAITTAESITARPGAAGGWTLSGHIPVAFDLPGANLLVLTARTDTGTGVFVLDPASDGLTVEHRHGLDLTRPVAAVTLAGSAARPVGPADASVAIAHAMTHALAALAAEQLGGAQACLDMAVDYAKTRIQFGRPIGTFQAVKHRCAELVMQIEFARAASAYASWALTGDPDDAPLASAVAKSYCSDTYVRAATDNIQVHGGIGFTWEHPAHLYLRRAKATALYLGTPSVQRARVASALAL